MQVKTQLENPTRYFIAQQQKRQVKEYLKNQSPSAAGDLILASQPTLNAINQQAVAALSVGHLVGQPGSPMAVMSPEGNHTTDVRTQSYFLEVLYQILLPLRGNRSALATVCLNEFLSPCLLLNQAPNLF